MTREDESPSQRETRLRQIRAEIGAGVYETPARLSAAVDALLADFEGRANSADESPRRPK